MPSRSDRSSFSHDHKLDLVMLGDSKVGKSSMLLQWADGKFDPDITSTIGIDYGNKILKIDDEHVNVYVWDTAGQERFRTIAMAYYRNAMGVLLVYDVTERDSLKNVQHWMGSLKTNASEDIVIILIGNKTDKENERVISYNEGATVAKGIGCPFFETSALNGSNIDDAFISITKQCKDKLVADQEILLKLNGKVSIHTEGRISKKCSQCSGSTSVGVKNILRRVTRKNSKTIKS